MRKLIALLLVILDLACKPASVLAKMKVQAIIARSFIGHDRLHADGGTG